jgi:hypothetical protein
MVYQLALQLGAVGARRPGERKKGANRNNTTEARVAVKCEAWENAIHRLVGAQ